MMYESVLYCSDCGAPMETRELQSHTFDERTGKPYRRFARACHNVWHVRLLDFILGKRHDYREWEEHP